MERYTYYRSTSSYRVRIALALKGLDYRALPVTRLRRLLKKHRHLPDLFVDLSSYLSA